MIDAMTSKLIVKPATPRDHAFLVQGNLALARESEDKTLSENTVSSGVQAVLDDESLGMYLLAWDGETPVGQLMITYEWSDWRNGRFAWIQSVYVVPSARRRGVFRALFSALKEMAQTPAGWIGFRLYVDQDNETAMKVYHALGFTQTHYHLYEWMPS